VSEAAASASSEGREKLRRLIRFVRGPAHAGLDRNEATSCNSEVIDVASSNAMPQPAGPASILLVEDQDGVRSLLVRFDARNPVFDNLTPDQVILKPFTPMQLAQSVESALAEARQRRNG
jgi:hypothetical protein